jgi:hypothetical protein
MQQITTVTFFKYKGAAAKIWAFGMMQFAHAPLQKVQGLSFYKLMGSGAGIGFSIVPDWSVYCLLQVWETEADATAFLEKSELMQRYRAKTVEIWTVYLKNIVAKGTWSGQSPFSPAIAMEACTGPIAILTRAAIRPRRLRAFWKYVPISQRHLSDYPALRFQKGVGEAPILQMATFSIWENFEAVRQFAYLDKEHQKAIQLTKQLDWYSEELFARFCPYRFEGSWQGQKGGPI